MASNSKNGGKQREIYEVEATGCGGLLDMRSEGIGKLIDDSNIPS